MILSLIAAIGKNNELGKGNRLLWHMPADMKHFREVTVGHPIIMGRKTFESLGRPLPNRRNIVITRDKTYTSHGVYIVNSLEEAIEQIKDEDEVFIIGGAEIYKQAINIADKLDITEIDTTDETADVFFPAIGVEWQEVSRENHETDEKNHIPYAFVTYHRRVS